MSNNTFESVIRRASKERVILTVASEKDARNLRNKLYKERKKLIVIYPDQYESFCHDSKMVLRADGKCDLILQPQLYGIEIAMPESVQVSYQNVIETTQEMEDSTQGILNLIGGGK